MPTFSGSGFKLESVTQNAPATIRVRFTQDPKAVNPAASNDALNPTNYTLEGPVANAVSNCGMVFGDTQSIDLFLNTALAGGTWTLIASTNIVAYDGSTPLSAPTSMSFTVASVNQESPINPGAVNAPTSDIIRQFLNPYLKGDGWDAMIAALSAGEQINWDNAKLAFEQLFTSTASGLYLDRRAADFGVVKPVNIGMPDDLFRQYVIRLTNGKLTEESLLELLEIFYGQDAVRANDQSGLQEPFGLLDGWDLQILFDERILIPVIFSQDQFGVIGQARAIEVSTVITNACRQAGIDAYAVPYADPQTQKVYIRIYSGSLGLGSSVRVIGGHAQNALQFPTVLNVFTPSMGWSVTWTITFNAATGRLRFATNSTYIDLSQLQIGDYVNIFGSEFATSNKGSFPVMDVNFVGSGSSWFEVEQNGFTQTVSQVSLDAILYFRPTRKTTHTIAAREVVVAQPIGTEVDVILPATSQAVARHSGSAAYAQVNQPLTISALVRYANGVALATTTAPHGLSISDQILIDGSDPGLVVPATVPGTPFAIGPSTTDSAPISIVSAGNYRNITGVRGVVCQINSSLVMAYAGFDGATMELTYATDLYSTTSIVVDPTTNDKVAHFNNTLPIGGGVGVVNGPWYFCGSSLGIINPHIAGYVLATGGYDAQGVFTPALEANTEAALWNPITYKWTSTTAMNNKRAGHVQESIQVSPGVGKVLVAGGMNLKNRATTSCEIYDPTALTWTNSTSMNSARCQHAAAATGSKFLIAGGRPLANGFFVEADTQALYTMDDPVTGTMADTSGNGLTLTDVGTQVKIVGNSGYARSYGVGVYQHRTSSDAALAAAFTSGNFTVEGFLESAFSGGPLVTYAVTNGGSSVSNTLFGCGLDTSSGLQFKVWWQDGSNVTQNVLTTTGSAVNSALNVYQWCYWAVTVSNDGVTTTITLYLNGTQILQTTTASTNLPFDGSTSVLNLGYDPAGISPYQYHGGLDEIRISSTAHDSTHIFNAYQDAVGALIPEDSTRIGRVVNTCELYDPSADTWTRVGSMAHARYDHVLVPLPDGKVLAVGGMGLDPTQPGSYASELSSSEIWDPLTNTWQPCGHMSDVHGTPFAVYVPSLNAVVAGGGKTSTNVEIFDVATRKWRKSIATLPGIVWQGKGFLIKQSGVEVVLIVAGFNGVGGIDGINYFFIPNSEAIMQGGLNGIFPVVSTPSSTQFTFLTPDDAVYSSISANATVTALKAVTDAIPGPYLFNPKDGVAVTAAQSTTTSAIATGHSYNILNVVDATQFPDEEGWLVLGFGQSYQVAPVRYFGRISSNQLSIDVNFKFPINVPSGANVTLLDGKGAFIPPGEIDGAFYLTDSPAGRIAASAAVDEATAAGVDVNKTITYPGDRGLGNEGYPTHGNYKVTDAVRVWGGDFYDAEAAAAEEE